MPEKALSEKTNTMENTFDTMLPEDFDGTFKFSNWTDEDFEGRWGGMAYTYPANKRTPMVILNATPLEIQNIRKKFARELSEREFFKSKKYESLRSSEGMKDENGVLKPNFQSITQARSYTDLDLKEYIQRCLEPLPAATQSVSEVPKVRVEDMLRRDEDGETHTQVAIKGRPLRLRDKESKSLAV